ncbi:uncharacterized protein LOC143349942 [Colletes latitarsis]|uniref:uncharacterized protein LOC143349942 n=1 Tax=Colletes latitarsis TaxID=2605962 RepID=UPI004036602A
MVVTFELSRDEMSKTRRVSRQSQYGIDETELIKVIKMYPSLYNPNLQTEEAEFTVESHWEEISDKLNAPVDVLKKKWQKIKDSYGRRRSLRSVQDLNFLPLSTLDASNYNSCASSDCSSPKEGRKRSVRSVSQLSTASETEGTASMASSIIARSKQSNSKPKTRMSLSRQKDTGSANETKSVDSNVRGFQEMSSIGEDSRPALSESFSQSSKENRQNDANTPSRRLSDASSGKSKAKKHNTADSTRAFFESMAMTVSTFPQHIQATLKIRICNLVGDAEYGLTIPKPC